MSTSVAAPAGASFVDTPIQTGKPGARTTVGSRPILQYQTIEGASQNVLDAVNLGLRAVFGGKLAVRSLTDRTVKLKKGGERTIAALTDDQFAQSQLSFTVGSNGNATPQSRIRKATKANPAVAAQAASLIERLSAMTDEQRAAFLASVG